MQKTYNVGDRVLCSRHKDKDPEAGEIKERSPKYNYRVKLDSGEYIDILSVFIKLEGKTACTNCGKKVEDPELTICDSCYNNFCEER